MCGLLRKRPEVERFFFCLQAFVLSLLAVVSVNNYLVNKKTMPKIKTTDKDNSKT